MDMKNKDATNFQQLEKTDMKKIKGGQDYIIVIGPDGKENKIPI
jgi:hypothetical protein